ncbi:syntaxin-43-like [Dorcoceras hygrometricum]|uniref:Syntaxin-43-like n=1 Tax=Dorcoceras hygrometricum TaxID=472368 RepID=A0A2Z7D737_9LAMI|nr:syntaxin-43-like [Dorcoceras hygrometricum]
MQCDLFLEVRTSMSYVSPSSFFRKVPLEDESPSLAPVHSRPSLSSHKPPPPPRVAGTRSGQFDEENPFVHNLSVLLVQADKGISVLVVDRIGYIYRSLPRRADVIVTTVGARHKCQQGSGLNPLCMSIIVIEFFVLIVSRLLFYVLPLPRWGADPDPQQLLQRLT